MTIGFNAEPGFYGEVYPIEAAPPPLTVKHKIGVMTDMARKTKKTVDTSAVAFIPYGTRLGADENGIAKTIAKIDAKFPQCVAQTVSFAQNQREEVRDLKDAATALSAEAGTHQTTYVAEVQTYENHAQDSRVQDIGDVAPTQGSSNANSAGVSGNNPLVVFAKASHARNKNGDGERYEESEVAQTRNTFDQGETRAQEIVVANPWDTQSQQVHIGDGAFPPLAANGKTERRHEGSDRRAVVVEARKSAPDVCKTLSAEGFDGMPDIHKGNGMPVVAIEGNGSRPSHYGDGYSEEGVGYTLNHVEQHAVAVRTANTHANGHGVAEEATHTLDCASGQAVAVGFKAGQSANGGLGIEEEVCPTQSHQPSALEPTVAIGCDRRNQSGADEVQPALQSTVSDGGSTVAVGVDTFNQALTGDVSRSLNSAATDSDHLPVAALHHIVRRLTVVECSRLQGFPDWWVRIPVGKWRKIDEYERDYLAGLGPWYRSHIRETGKPGVWETDLSSDSPAYKALGNSWATNCAEYILRRIVAAFRLDMIPESAE